MFTLRVELNFCLNLLFTSYLFMHVDSYIIKQNFNIKHLKSEKYKGIDLLLLLN